MENNPFHTLIHSTNTSLTNKFHSFENDQHTNTYSRKQNSQNTQNTPHSLNITKTNSSTTGNHHHSHQSQHQPTQSNRSKLTLTLPHNSNFSNSHKSQTADLTPHESNLSDFSVFPDFFFTNQNQTPTTTTTTPKNHTNFIPTLSHQSTRNTNLRHPNSTHHNHLFRNFSATSNLLSPGSSSTNFEPKSRNHSSSNMVRINSFTNPGLDNEDDRIQDLNNTLIFDNSVGSHHQSGVNSGNFSDQTIQRQSIASNFTLKSLNLQTSPTETNSQLIQRTFSSTAPNAQNSQQNSQHLTQQQPQQHQHTPHTDSSHQHLHDNFHSCQTHLPNLSQEIENSCSNNYKNNNDNENNLVDIITPYSHNNQIGDNTDSNLHNHINLNSPTSLDQNSILSENEGEELIDTPRDHASHLSQNLLVRNYPSSTNSKFKSSEGGNLRKLSKKRLSGIHVNLLLVWVLSDGN